MRRPSNRLKEIYEPGRGKAQIIETPKQLAHILWAASRGATGLRNVALLWMLFGSGLRINEAAQLKVKDIFDFDGELKDSFKLPGSYTKTGKPRMIFLLVKACNCRNIGRNMPYTLALYIYAIYYCYILI